MSGYRPPSSPELNGGAEIYELGEDGNLLHQPHTSPFTKRYYPDGSSIDWLYEDAKEREILQAQKSHRGARGILVPWLDSVRMWVVIVGTGIGIGLAGAWLDVLVKWLADLREGRCTVGFFYNQVTCCSGFDAGEYCAVWKPWSEYLNVKYIFAASLLQIAIYVSLAIAFAGSAAILVTTYAPYAFHTGIPEIKAILRGYVLEAFLTPWTLLIKALGLALAVASGLSLGKEGPLVHVACCLASLLLRFFKDLQNREGQKRRLLAASAAAGISVAFGSPLGGVLFCLEELDAFANESEIMWRGFVASAIAAVALQYVDPFQTAKLVLFQVTEGGDTWRAFELIPWMSLGVIGGVLGSLLIKLNVEVAIYRRNSVLNDWPVLEVVGASAVTAAISYLVVFTRVQSSELVANLFQECDSSRRDYHGLCNPTAIRENVFLLLITVALKLAFTAWTFGMMIPAGIFLPTITIGACLGRAVGIVTQSVQSNHATAWLFQACPPDPTVRCVSPGFYAVIGASAMLAGVTRMTISLVVIMFELTGALSHVLPIMISVMTAKWVGDALGKDGIYSVWIAMRKYPWMPPDDYHDKGETATGIMRPAEKLVVIEDGKSTLEDLGHLLKSHGYRGFPVVDHQNLLLGYVTRDTIEASINHQHEGAKNQKCFFSSKDHASASDYIDLSGCLEKSVLHLRKEVPRELVVRIFQRMNVRQILFTRSGNLVGMITRSDVVALLTNHFPHTGALS
ncbi:voltage-gated chloride [Moniliophthora roreri MCA 2997]|uniref:Chloride channel protein n=1 Tax=Moniliophthora roreri (strain MCA 2997) TaxID=1381753 RepID=V2XY65_MONRO|nr:voltage-gated chloride [Moniliophthora roreri MCA 2997]